jgi:hypothetical protein
VQVTGSANCRSIIRANDNPCRYDLVLVTIEVESFLDPERTNLSTLHRTGNMYYHLW